VEEKRRRAKETRCRGNGGRDDCVRVKIKTLVRVVREMNEMAPVVFRFVSVSIITTVIINKSR